MRRMLVVVAVCLFAMTPAGAHADKKPKPPPVDGKVPYGMCSVVDVVVKSKQHPCPED